MPIAVPTEKSTTVRPKDWRLGSLRVAFAALEHIAPSLAGRWALRIWCTLPGGALRRHDNRPHEGIRSDTTLADGRRIAVEIWEPSSDDGPRTRPVAEPAVRTVLLVHGWGGWRGQLGAFVDPLLDAGWRVVAFDVAGHGDSDPSLIGRGRATAVDFIEALTAVVARHGEPDSIVAHSLGSATTALAVRDGVRARRLTFIAPSPDPVATTDRLEKLLGYGPRTRRRLLTHLSRLAARPLDDFNALRVSSQEDVPPALVVHDRQDTRNPYDDGVQLAEAWPEAELVSTDGLGHHRILLDRGVLKLVVDYVTT
ncbi:alpha/beta fold hydrolase [Phytoactinopolyspora halotolerans]|uniref:Alpha/beta hydrolase n=1 Tax=Phytoactinopolyspora halotolerans TaxID=1981512 RepID=A0A6L9SE92_9ACTN|nr:alpha/beta fold hydrolase [Phytoactinopolyspora halotolerans]NEE02832.1 alpha/beta hydrolase [Phytoactinopolyspora halotolerans]